MNQTGRAHRYGLTHEYLVLPPIPKVIQVPEPLTRGTHKVSEDVVILWEKVDPCLTQVQLHPAVIRLRSLSN